MVVTARGPIEDIWQQLSAGELNDAGALERARETSSKLTVAYITYLSNLMVPLAVESPSSALRLVRLTLAAVDAAIGAEAHRMRRIAKVVWVEVVTRAVTDIPDGRLFREAVAMGEHLVAEALASDDHRTAWN